MVLLLLLAGTILAVPPVVLVVALPQREAQAVAAAGLVGNQLVWPDTLGTADPGMTLDILSEAADATGSNVIRTSVRSTGKGRTSIVHYVYLGAERTRLFDEFSLAQGRWPNQAETRSGTAVVSSVPGAHGTVGVPCVLGGSFDLTFAPLHQAYDSLPAAGTYTVEAPDPAAGRRFVSIVGQRLVEAKVIDPALLPDDLSPPTPAVAPRSVAFLQAVPYLLVGIATVLVVSTLVRDGKKIGVLLLLGHSAVRIWYSVVGRLEAVSVGSALLVACALVLGVPGADRSFVAELSQALFALVATIIAVTVSVGIAVISRTDVGDLVKGSLQ